MAFNPFLSMGDSSAPVQAEALNPFMIGGDEEPVILTSENPFAASNPFADFAAPATEPIITIPMDIFGTMEPAPVQATKCVDIKSNNDFHCDSFSIQAMDFTEPLPPIIKPNQLDLASSTMSVYSSDEELQKPKRPPPPPARPLPPETQNLILSVTGHMDYTSSHLLDRIPPTRTPSPVSMRDLHTPEPDQAFDYELSLPEASHMDTQSQHFVAPVQPLEDVRIAQSTTNGNEIFDINQNKPVRPARPPPARPLPPPVPPPVSHPAPPMSQKIDPKQHDNEINLFDAPAQPPAKPTKEDILSLYSNKKEEKQIDFLSDDILDNLTDPSQDAPKMESPTKLPAVPGTTPASSSAILISDKDFHNASNDNIPAFESSLLSDNVTSNKPTVESVVEPISFEPKVLESETATTDSFGASGVKNPFEAMENSYLESAESNAVIESNNAFTKSSNAFTEPSNLFNDLTIAINESSNTFNNTDNAFNQVNTLSDPSNAFGQAMIQSDSGFGGTTPQNASAFPPQSDDFDAFSAKFDAFSNSQATGGSAWGATEEPAAGGSEGFEGDEGFDAFLSMHAPSAPAATPAVAFKEDSQDSDDGNFSVFIKPKNTDGSSDVAQGGVPVLAPPPRPQALPESPRVNPFDSQPFAEPADAQPRIDAADGERKSGSETPPTPLFDDDVSMPLEDFPRVVYEGPGWEMQLRQPNKKKITGQRFWKKIFVKLAFQGDNPVVQLYNSPTDKEPFQELPLQACYSVSEIGAQQYDQFGKIFTVKLQYIFYKERPGVRPGQVTKAERITNKLSQFAAYAIQGDYQGVKEFGSDLKKLGLPVEHAPQISQLFKIGSLNYEDVKQFSVCIEEALFKLHAHRDRALTYKMEEVQITAVDELYVEQDAEGSVLKQIARVRLFFLGFLSGMPDIELGVNDLRRQGKEVVGRHDIIPVVTEEWIRVEDTEFHACVQPEEFTKTQIIKFKPPDACYIELMRFRIRPPKNRELPLQLKAVMCVTGNKVELRADVLVPGFASRKLGQVPCEDVMIRFPIPECWIYLFRVEKHFRYGSVKSAHRRTGKIKGIERFLGTVETLQESLIEVTSGQAKYEHQHRAIVWRMPRLPKEGQGAYTTHNLVCRMALTSYDQIPPELAKFAYVEFTMPATQVSHMTVRSVSLQNHDSDEPPEKYVRYLARHEYTVGIEHTTGSTTAAYVAAASVPSQPAPAPAPILPTVPQAPSSDSDSD